MVRKFEQIQYAAIVEYSSPLVGPKPVVGIFYKQSWEFMWYADGKQHIIKVTPSQTCVQLEHPLALLNNKYMGFYADLSTAKQEKEENSEW